MIVDVEEGVYRWVGYWWDFRFELLPLQRALLSDSNDR